MTNEIDVPELLSSIVELARSASAAAMEIYDSHSVAVEYKADTSPVTNADLAANRVIIDGLRRLTPTIPIVSEESLEALDGTNFAGASYWLVDPIDGTKEFLAHNGEFTVNVGLIIAGEPVLGVVDAPAKQLLFYGCRGSQSCKQVGDRPPEAITVAGRDKPVVAISRSHPNPETAMWLEQFGLRPRLQIGSSLKLCLVADGTADLAPRLGPQHEWDIAAADAVLRSAGGQLTDLDTKQPVRYGRPSELTPYYLASGRNQAATYL